MFSPDILQWSLIINELDHSEFVNVFLLENQFEYQRAAAYAVFARIRGFHIDGQNEIGRFRVEASDKEGEWLDREFPHGGQNKDLTNSEVELVNLAIMPATKYESSQARTIHNAEPDLVKSVMDDIEDSGDVITPRP